MTPLGLILGGAALVGIGVGVGVWAERARWRHFLDAWLDMHHQELRRVEGERDQALRMVYRFTRQRLADAAERDADNPFRGQWVAPTPQAWAAFQEGFEKPWRN